MLLSLILPSYIVVFKRELVNILNPSTSKPQNNQLYYSKQYSIDIEANLSREQFSSPSMNSLKKYLSILLLYQWNIQNTYKLSLETWHRQNKLRTGKYKTLLYSILCTFKNYTYGAYKWLYVPHETETNNVLSSQSLEPLVILYQANQLADLQLWDSNFCLISLFGICYSALGH